MDKENYKKLHEDFMKNVNGTTAWETYSLIFPSFLPIFISTILFSYVAVLLNLRTDTVRQFLYEFCILVLPVILWVTILSDFINIIFTVLLFISITILFIFKRLFDNKIDTSKIRIDEYHRCYITNIRSVIGLITAICILAVDFKVFPRRFAKTESFGYSLMDVGVGLYIFSNGIVAPFIYNEDTENIVYPIYKSIVDSIPLFVLGTARFVVTSELDYQVPVAEYGIHWNFFITLAVTKVLCSIILAVIQKKYIIYVSIATFFLHEYTLSLGLRDWVLSDVKRDDFLSANREGISSVLGYVGLYLMSTLVGTIMHIKINNCFSKNRQLAVSLFILSLGFFYVSVLMKNTTGISRRLANTAYCFWVMFIGVSMSMLILVVDLINRYVFFALSAFFREKKLEVEMQYSPMIYKAINCNGLIFFLFANLLTGCVNLIIDTLQIGTLHSLIIIILYMLIVCSVMTYLYLVNFKFKIW